MKKIFFLILLFMGSFGFAMAQSKTKAKAPKKAETAVVTSGSQSTTGKKVTKARAHHEKKVAQKKTVAIAPGSTTHLKANGTPDKRFKENKVTTTHLKKNGTPDKRFKENKIKSKS